MAARERRRRRSTARRFCSAGTAYRPCPRRSPQRTGARRATRLGRAALSNHPARNQCPGQSGKSGN
eukprot:scaffold3177_cov86-Phaeocystis_antarctica.AAC.15